MTPTTTAHRFHAMTLRHLALSCLLLSTAARAQYTAADVGQRPLSGGVSVLPEAFLRGYDPVTVYFDADQVSAKGPADDGPKFLSFAPAWPGAYTWVDQRTLQFRPAEPWPALARFAVKARGATKVLTTMMAPPSAMAPAAGSEGLRPFRVVTLTFPQALPPASLKRMLSLELRDLPGLADSPRRKVQSFSLAPLPRASQRDPSSWALTLEDDVPEGKQLVVSVSLALGTEGTTLWTGRVSTRTPFTLQSVQCGNASFPLVGGASTPRDLALGCGNRGDLPQLVFSAQVADLTLTSLRKLVHLEPSVPDLRFTPYGERVQLQGKFVPDTLYKLTIGPAPIRDDAGRALRDVKPADVYFHLGWKASFLRFTQATAIVEAKGPRMVPVQGYGEPRADVRVYRVDPLHSGLWPFPSSPVVVDEQSAPPFPGEEPATPPVPGAIDARTLQQHLRLLGSPLVSRIVDLPLGDKANTTSFGLDLKALVDPRPGTYLVGLRRLTGRPERAYVRVQITNLTVTSVEETDKAVIYVRALDTGDGVRGATVRVEGTHAETGAPVSEERTSDADGRVVLTPRTGWSTITRVWVKNGDDVLVLDPRESLPSFANNHWSSYGSWLSWLLTSSVPPPPNDTTLGFVFSERPIYKPGEPVFLKAYVRRRESGGLRVPSALGEYKLRVRGPDGTEYPVTSSSTGLGALAATFKEEGVPTGDFSAELVHAPPRGAATVISTRSFKIEAYRVPTFEVQLSGGPRVRNDAPFKVKAVARYYAGGNVANQPIAWSVTQRPWVWTPKGLAGFLFASSAQFARPQSQRSPGVTSQQGELDDSGAAELTTNPQLDLDGAGRVYRFEATVTGPDDQPVTSATEVKALPPFVLGLKVPRYLEKATELKTELVAVGIDDKPLEGQEVRVRLLRRVWHSTLRETSFATGKAKYQTEQEDLQVAEKTLKSLSGPLAQVFPIKDSGIYVVELFARDKLGRVQTLSADLYVGGTTPLSWQKSRDGVFEVKPDKKSYAPGEVAHLVVQSPYATARALAVVEDPTGNRYLWRDVQGSRVVIDVPITDRHVPNLPVHVVLMRGRIGEGKTDDSRYKPATAASTLELEVEPVKNQVMVTVAHPEVARPGTRHDFTISLTDEAKRPIGGEVTLWLVDEAVLSLAKEATLDPLSELIRRNARTVSVRDSRNLVVGRVTELEEDPGGDGGDEDSRGSKRLVRKEFKTVPYYAATLTVPASGTLVVPIQLSDDLTNFRVRAVAVSGATRFGHKQSTLRVRLPVLVQPQLPRLVRVGDSFWPGAVARVVEGPDGPASVDISVSGAVEGKRTLSERVELKSTKAQSVLTPVTVKAAPMGTPSVVTVRVDVTRLSDKAGDAFEVKLPLLPDRNVERAASLVTLQPGPNVLKPFSEPARPGTATQSYVFTNQPGVLELASSLEYLSAYPHGCLEQRMSQVYPDLVLGSLLKKLELDTRFTPQVQANTRKLLEELAQHQDASGFLGYWPGSQGNVQLTAAGVEFMTMAKKAGVNVDEKVRTRAVDGLKRVLRKDFNGLWSDYRFNQQTAALRALARVGDLDDNYAAELFYGRASMDSTAVADLTSAMAERPGVFASNLGTLKGELWDELVFKLVKGARVFDRLRRDRASWSGLYLGSSTSAVAAVWEALLRVDPSNAQHTLMRDALLAKASAGAGFGSTYDNRRAISAFALYLERAQTSQGRTTVTLSGLPDVVLDDAKKAGRRVIDAEQVPAVTVTGGPVGARLQVKYLPLQPGDRADAKKEGLIVSRSLTRYPADGSAAVNVDDSAGATLSVPLGEVLEVHAQLTTDEPRQHVAFVVPFAAGLEPLNPNLETSGSDARPSQADSLTPTAVQRLDGEVRYAFTELPRGTHTFHFRVRASSEGSFVHPPPFAELMYREEVRGRGVGTRVIVTGTRQQ